MFGFGKKKGAAQGEAPEQGKPSARRLPVVLAGVVVLAALGYLAYEYLPGLLDETPPPVPVASRPVGVAEKAPASTPEPAVAPAQQPEPKPAPVAAPAPKPEPKPSRVAAPAPKPEPKPAVVEVAAAPTAPAPEKPEPQARPALSAPMAAPVSGPAATALKYNDVMTAVLYRDREAVAQLLDLGRWADKRDSKGYTPLMAAVHNRDYSMVQLLLERGADPGLQAPGGAAALDMSRQTGDGAIESLLLKFGAR